MPEYKPTDSLNGLRVVSMIWIILGHTFLMPTGISGYANMEDIHSTVLDKDSAETNPLFFFVVSSQAGVDTFFFLSGFLLSLLTVRELQSRNGKISIPAAIFLRYARLTPSLAMVMLVYYKVWSMFGFGPFAPRFQDSIYERCDGSWWSELTYTMNFIPFDSDKVCMGWSWYLGDDMIFFIITIALLPLYYRRKWLGWAAVGILMALSFGITWSLIVSHGLSIYVFDDHYTKYSYWAYSKPYTRIPAYLIGVVAAWVILELEQRGVVRQTVRFNQSAKVLARIAVVLAFAGLAFMTFIPATDFGEQANSWDKHSIFSVLYLAFGRALWALCWAVITLACYYDYVPIVDAVLSHRCWTPLARLTYGAYLIHPLCIKLAAGTSMQYYTFSGMDLFYRHLGNCTCAYGGSVVLWCIVERPMITFTSVFLRSKSRQGGNRKESGVSLQNTPDNQGGVASQEDVNSRDKDQARKVVGTSHVERV
jgi:peptidoglycan/LPS O-acetylase OafA/YrhL